MHFLIRMCCVQSKRTAQKSLSSGVSNLRRMVGHQNDTEDREVAGYEEMEGVDHDEDSLDSKTEIAQDEEWGKPRVSSKAQNWCDLFFILDILASRYLSSYSWEILNVARKIFLLAPIRAMCWSSWVESTATCMTFHRQRCQLSPDQ